jgi:error-prone DNA polymerase
MGFYPPHVLTNDAKRHGVRVLPPDVNRSGARCTVEGNAVRIGFGYVDGVGEDAARLIERERELAGRYRSLADFVRRIPLKREAIENLIAVGVFDSFGLGRREALWQLALFIPARGFGRPAAAKPAEPGRQQPLALPVDRDMVELRPMSPWEQMAADYDTLGLSPRYHPLGLLRPHLPEEILTTEDLAAIRDGAHIQVAGMVVCRQRPHTAKGITFLLLEDERGLVNVIVYPALYEDQRLLVRGEPFLVVEGRLQQREGTINIVAEHLQTLDDARRMFTPAPDQPDQQPASDPRTFAPAAHNFH